MCFEVAYGATVLGLLYYRLGLLAGSMQCTVVHLEVSDGEAVGFEVHRGESVAVVKYRAARYRSAHTHLEVRDGEAVVFEVHHHLPAGHVPHMQLTTSTTRRNEITPAAVDSVSEGRPCSRANFDVRAV